MLSPTVYAFPTDKTLHISAGIITYSIADYFQFEKPIRYVLLVSAGKEIYDHYNDGSVELGDILAGLTGGVIAFNLIEFSW